MVCTKIIEHHKGALNIESIEGHGTTVEIFLPLAKEGMLVQ